MKAHLFLANGDHQHQHATWMTEGLKAHGVNVRTASSDDDVDCDFCVVWGYRQIPMFEKAKEAGTPVLVLERGHLQPRMQETSMGWNGLAGLGVRPECQDLGERFKSKFGHYLKPWRRDGDYVLVMGQTNGDASLHGLNFRNWAQAVCDAYRGEGHRVVFRPHPLADQYAHPTGVEVHQGLDLEQSFSGAKLCVTYTSTSAVEAVLAGIPTISCHDGSIARPVTAHGALADPIRPGRMMWAMRLAWCQFTIDEIRNGTAWQTMKTCMPRA